MGDLVIYERSSVNQGVIVKIETRSNLLYRSDQLKSKLLSANLDQVLIMLATEAYFSEDLLGRALIKAEANELAQYRESGYDVVELSVKSTPEATLEQLMPRPAKHEIILLGPSGMGKATLVNLIVPEAGAATREISATLNTACHTPLHTALPARRWRNPDRFDGFPGARALPPDQRPVGVCLP